MITHTNTVRIENEDGVFLNIYRPDGIDSEYEFIIDTYPSEKGFEFSKRDLAIIIEALKTVVGD